jgi:hypothetical protein
MSLLSTDIAKVKRLSLREVKLPAPEIRVERIKEATNVNQDRAERGFNLILQAVDIEQTINPELYYLVGSTPFKQ